MAPQSCIAALGSSGPLLPFDNQNPREIVLAATLGSKKYYAQHESLNLASSVPSIVDNTLEDAQEETSSTELHKRKMAKSEKGMKRKITAEMDDDCEDKVANNPELGAFNHTLEGNTYTFRPDKGRGSLSKHNQLLASFNIPEPMENYRLKTRRKLGVMKILEYDMDKKFTYDLPSGNKIHAVKQTTAATLDLMSLAYQSNLREYTHGEDF